MILDWRLQIEQEIHLLPRGTELLNLKSAFLNLKSPGPLGPDSLLNRWEQIVHVLPVLFPPKKGVMF